MDVNGAYSRLELNIPEDPRTALVVDTCEPATGEVFSVTCRGSAEIEVTSCGATTQALSTSAIAYPDLAHPATSQQPHGEAGQGEPKSRGAHLRGVE
ncbi:hypothetical protein ACIQWN_23775 [Streptomyces vinaceus]|uniref:hypothetical protein n=1 Tax=Streptomyces vinaceus TaxID=1960 RepID=UPI00380E30E4